MSFPRRAARYRAITALIALLILGLMPSATAQSVIPSEFRFLGSGYGHGVGMSQIGARGLALEGKSAAEIISYYYPGTQITPYPDNELIRVNIANRVTEATLRVLKSKGSFQLFRGDIPFGQVAEPVGTYDGTFTANFAHALGVITPSLTSPTAKLAPFPPGPSWTIRWESGTVMSMTTAAGTNQYAYGQINLKNVSTKVSNYLAITTTLRLHDEYLWGLGEVPSSWPPAALEAQVIAARTYALTKMARIRAECDCNIYSTIVDQNFVGYSKESEPIWGIKWKEAVARTFVDQDNALTITVNNLPINAFYFSSSGGRTQNVTEVWGGRADYLLGVPDPWSLDPSINPRYALWSRTVPQALIAQAFGLPNVVDYSIITRTATGSVARITGFAQNGKSVTLTGEAFRSRLNLPSTWIRDERPPMLELPQSDECDPERAYRTRFCLS